MLCMASCIISHAFLSFCLCLGLLAVLDHSNFQRSDAMDNNYEAERQMDFYGPKSNYHWRMHMNLNVFNQLLNHDVRASRVLAWH